MLCIKSGWARVVRGCHDHRELGAQALPAAEKSLKGWFGASLDEMGQAWLSGRRISGEPGLRARSLCQGPLL